MRKGRGPARWGWLAVGALGLVGPVAGQGPQWSPPATSRPAVPATQGEPPAAIRDAAHVSVMQVEIAWLADPDLFPYQLVARVNGARLEAHGYVPSMAVRDKALAVARGHSRLQVVDALKTYPSLPQRLGGEPAETVRKTAVEVLTEAFPDQVQGFQVTAGPDGRVKIAGAVRSLEDKWKACRYLRRVRGCTSVENSLEPALAADAQVTPATDRWTPARPPAPAPVQAAARELAAPPPLPSPTDGRKPTLAVLPPGTSLNLRPVPEPPRPPVNGGQRTTDPGSSPAKSGKPAPVAPDVSGGVVVARFDQPAVPAPPPAPNRDTPKTKQVAASGDARVSAGVEGDRGERIAPAAGAPKPGKAGSGYVTSGAILIAEDRPAPRSADPAGDEAARLRQCLAVVCGPAARDLEVVARPADGFEVRCKVHDRTEADRLAATVRGLPDLLKSHLSFRVRIEP